MTKDEIRVVIDIVGDAIKEMREVPAGSLYAVLCGVLDLETFETIISQLEAAGLVERSASHLLRWIGPV